MTKKFTVNSLLDELKFSLEGHDIDQRHLLEVLKLSFNAHNGQVREQRDQFYKDTIPYITHPVGVAKLASKFFNEAYLDDSIIDVVDACLLHDVLEDTSTDIFTLAEYISERAVDLVRALTKPNVSSSLSRDQRNKYFINQICLAGKTAAFIKIMDSMHNLSRPKTMPKRLLKNTVVKSRASIVPLLSKFKFSSELKDEYSNVLRIAAQTKVNDAGQSGFFETPQEFLQVCFSKLKGKVLEAHDILNILLEIPGLQLIYEGSVLNFFKIYIKDRQVDKKYKVQSYLSKIPNMSSFNNNNLMEQIAASFDVDNIIILQLDDHIIEPQHRIFLFIGQKKQISPNWVTWEILQPTLNLLSERYRIRQRQDINELTELIARSQISLSPSIAIKANFTPIMLLELQSLLERAKIIQNVLNEQIKKIISRMDFSLDHVGFECRIKTPDSMITKILSDRYNSLTEIDDIFGMRVILPTKAHIEKISDVISKKFINLNIPFLGKVKSYSCKSICTHSGYRAIHIHFWVESSGHSSQHLTGCEIQLRTVFEDAWARIAHISSYKVNNRQVPINKKRLKELSNRCVELDNEVNTLFKK